MLLCAQPATKRHGVLALPRIRLETDPSVGDIVPRLAELLRGPVIPLRANALSWHENFDAASMVVEVEPWDAVAPQGFCWRRHRRVRSRLCVAGVGTTLPWLLGSMNAQPVGRLFGHSGPGRDGSPGQVPGCSRRWSSPDTSLLEPPRVHHLWGASVVLAADSLTGPAYLKCSGERFRAEAAVTRALATLSPQLLPDVVAVEPEHGLALDARLRGSRARRPVRVHMGSGPRCTGRAAADVAGTHRRSLGARSGGPSVDRSCHVGRRDDC